MSLRTFFLPLLLLTILSITACKKSKYNPNSDNGLPPATQTGANIFACRINGVPFIAYNDINYLGASRIKDTLLIGGSPKELNYIETILLQIVGDIHQGGTYNLNALNAIKLITDSTCLGISFDILTQTAIEGSIQIKKFDTVQKIVSGTYNCIIPVQDCDTLIITDGRFDIRYKQK